MRTSFLVIPVVGLFLIGLPSVASTGGIGACVIEDAIPVGGTLPGLGDSGGQFFDFCIDGTTEAFCLETCAEPGAPSDSGAIFGTCTWVPNEICADQDFSWDGACEVPGLFCILIDGPTPADSEALCDEGGKGGTTWFPGATTCGGAPVPALPKAAYAALALVLLAGSLALLTVYGGRT